MIRHFHNTICGGSLLAVLFFLVLFGVEVDSRVFWIVLACTCLFGIKDLRRVGTR